MEQKLKKQLSSQRNKSQKEDVKGAGRRLPPPWLLEEKE